MSFKQEGKLVNLKGHQITENTSTMALQEILLEDVEGWENQSNFQIDLECLQREELQKLLLLYQDLFQQL